MFIQAFICILLSLAVFTKAGDVTYLRGPSEYEVTGSFDWDMGNTCVWLSAAAYCPTNTYMTRTFKSYTSGFVATQVIDEKSSDVQGYIGYLPSKKSIFVVFRGSTSIKDWANNLDAILTNYSYCSKCEVHKGFYKAQQSVISQVISGVSSLQAKFPDYKVVVSGHSLGAAMATLTSLDLVQKGVVPANKLKLFDFGSPRVGNSEFAKWASSALPDRHRVTHYKDMVVHVPMHERFMHLSGEWYEDNDKSVRECSGYEDKNCSYQWHITSIDDHMNYLGQYVGCDAVSDSPDVVNAATLF